MGRGDDTKYRVKWTNVKNPVDFDHELGIFLFKAPSKVRAQNGQKNVAPAPLASNAAGSSVAVSNDKAVRYVYLPDSEISEAFDFSEVCA